MNGSDTGPRFKLALPLGTVIESIVGLNTELEVAIATLLPYQPQILNTNSVHAPNSAWNSYILLL